MLIKRRNQIVAAQALDTEAHGRRVAGHSIEHIKASETRKVCRLSNTIVVVSPKP